MPGQDGNLEYVNHCQLTPWLPEELADREFVPEDSLRLLLHSPKWTGPHRNLRKLYCSFQHRLQSEGD